MKFLIVKSICWEHEDEYRFLIKSENNFHKIGEITAVYFGDPYGNVNNSSDIYKNSVSLKAYRSFRKNMKEVVKGLNIPYVFVKIKGCRVAGNNENQQE